MRSALAFSGGRDSLALLLHLRALWEYVDVVFIDAGDALQSTYDTVATIKAHVPNFRIVRSDARAYRRDHGDPTDQTWAKCCGENFWLPMLNFLVEGGYRQVLRGDRADEGHVQSVMPGDVVEGILHTFPLWHWTERQVTDYVRKSGLLPPPYNFGAHGMPDCATCTAPAACGGLTRDLWGESIVKP